MCYQKRKISEHLDGLYRILKKKQYTQSTPDQFNRDWCKCEYNSGLNSVCIDLLYTVIMQNKIKLIGISNRIITEGIEGYLNADGIIRGKVKKPTTGMSRLAWEMLERLHENDMKYFDDIYQKLQEKNQEKNQEKT